jgi:DNA-binding ferritin-like protein (Dps family)
MLFKKIKELENRVVDLEKQLQDRSNKIEEYLINNAETSNENFKAIKNYLIPENQ